MGRKLNKMIELIGFSIFSVDGSTYYGAEPEQYEGADWLSRNLVAQYWRGEKLDIDTGQYLTCQLNRDWYAKMF